MIGIYKIENLETGNLYIGASKNLKQRMAEHRCPKPKHNLKLHEDIIKYGIEKFEISILETCELSNLNKKELSYIRELQPYYNTIGKPMSDKTKKKLSKSCKKWWVELPEETKCKIIKDNLKGPAIGHEVTKATREKLRMANLGKKRPVKIIIVETQQVFNSTEECAKFLNVTTGAVNYNLRGKTKLTKGYHIEYLSSVETSCDECNSVG